MRDSIQSQFEQYQDLMLNPCVRIRNDWCVDFWASPQLIHNQIDDCTFKHFDTLHQAINYYYDSILAQQDYNNLHTRISTALSNAIKKSTKKQSQLLNQQAQGQDYDKYKLYGELLLTYIYMVKYGDSQIDVYDYNNENQVTIQLNTTKNPSQNVADYFKKYNKKRKSVEMSITQLQQVNADLAYYQSLQETLATSTNKDDLDNLYQELVSCKLIDEVTKSKSNVTTSQPRMFEIDGFKVQIGKNNIQNDQLYRKAASTDIWLHAQKIHGCHAIISTRQKSPNLSTITKVAGLVAWFSKPKNVDKILVDYTTIKNVSKPRGSKPGMVSYVNQKTLWVTPDNSPIKDT
jgi:predicted ribosome quality control (RQC) complex YloA/Tae2 family protein